MCGVGNVWRERLCVFGNVLIHPNMDLVWSGLAWLLGVCLHGLPGGVLARAAWLWANKVPSSRGEYNPRVKQMRQFSDRVPLPEEVGSWEGLGRTRFS